MALHWAAPDNSFEPKPLRKLAQFRHDSGSGRIVWHRNHYPVFRRVTTNRIAYRGRLAADIPNGASAGTVPERQGKSEFSFDNGQINRIIDRS